MRGPRLRDAATPPRAPLLGSGLLLILAGSPAPAAEPWEAACSEPPSMPPLERAVALLPQAGEWRGKGFGDKRKLDVDLEECGRKIVGLAGVRLRGNVPKTVPLELDEDDGRYKASFNYSEGQAAVRVTWDLEVESESRIAGRMTIMGRGDNVFAELLEPKPSAHMAECECNATRSRRDGVAELLAALEDASEEASEGADRGWVTDPESCAVTTSTPDAAFPTQASYEALMTAAWDGELVHHRRCCTVSPTAAASGETYADWLRAAPDDARSDRIAALTAERDSLDRWLEERCAE